MDNPLPPAEELALIDRELFQLDARRHQLLSRREWLLRGRVPVVWGAPAPPAGPRPRPPKEASAPGAQNVLLVLGSVLLAVAALAFTLVSWGSLGIAGRGAVLGVVTAAALAAPAQLLRRGLRSTAEAVGAVGLLLTVLDAYALYAVGMPDTDGTAYAACAAAVLAALWAGYGRALPRLRIPLAAALLTAQLPLPLAALAAGADGLGLGWALLATAALDALLALLRPGRWTVWAAVTGSVTGGAALLTGLTASVASAATGPASTVLGASALLAATAALGVAVAWRPAGRAAFAAAGGVAAVAALGGPVAPELDPSWAAVAYLVVALALLATVRAPALPAPVRHGLWWAGAGVAALTALWGVSWAATVLAGRLRVLEEVWSVTTPPPAADGPGLAPLVALLLTAAAAWWLVRAVGPAASVAAVALGWAGAFTAPVALGLPPGPAFAAQLAVTAAATALALHPPTPSPAPAQAPAAAPAPYGGRAVAAAVCAVAGALNLSVAALDGRLATFGVLGLLGALCAAGAAYRPGAAWARSGAAALAVAYAAVLAVALGALLDLAVAWWAPLVLVVPAAVAALGPRLGSVRAPAEVSAAVSGLLAVALATGSAPVLALVLALAGVVCAGAAARPERRAVGWAAGALFLAATWVRLAASDVTVPEAYTLPVTVLALAVGFVRRRRDPLASSWVAYGPGLAATLLPSTVAVWGDPHWVRPLLLGAAALAVTLAGARRRLRAPLLLGGATLAAVAVHELTPYVVQVVDALPRWLPPALAGVLLLAVGATYEKRLRDARRLREAIGRLV
ncbi:hypothetical protein SAVIM338S_01573 [Streptomyces avidinii]